MSIPIFRTDDRALRRLAITPGAYGWLSVAVAWLTRGQWIDRDAVKAQDQWPMLDMTRSWYNINSVVESSYTIRELITIKHWRAV